MVRKEVCTPIVALVLVSLGGLLLHLRIHPPSKDADNWVPLVSCVLSIVVLPWLLHSSRTVTLGYLLNVASVMVGTVMMAWFSFEHWEGPVTWDTVLLKSTLADILILWARLPIAHVILRHYFPPKGPAAPNATA